MNECQPKADHFKLVCTDEKMNVEIDGVLFPNAEEVFLLGDCAGVYDSERKSSTNLEIEKL